MRKLIGAIYQYTEIVELLIVYNIDYMRDSTWTLNIYQTCNS